MNNYNKRENLIPDITNPSPDYFCTWQTQLYVTSDGKTVEQRSSIGEDWLFNKDYPRGWAYFYENARRDLIFVTDSGWDVDCGDVLTLRGSHILNHGKFPSFTGDNISPSEALKALCDKIKAIGWKGLGLWVASEECNAVFDGDVAEYWKERFTWSNDAGIAYWKVDNGAKRGNADFRRMLARTAHEYAPSLILENAVVGDSVSFSDTYRTYDVPAIMSIPMTLEKIYELRNVPLPQSDFSCLVSCEDEAYIAAALGFCMGIMRHPYKGVFPNGKRDMSFPSCHRDIKTKLAEVTRAVRWHKIAPAFAFDVSDIHFDNEMLRDKWQFININEEIEEWWLEVPAVKDSISDNIITKSAPAVISRGMELPSVTRDTDGNMPFVVAAKNPNGVISVAALGRTFAREYRIPECNVTIKGGKCDTFGVFGYYNNLVIQTELDLNGITVLMQDLADDTSYDITDKVSLGNGCIILPGNIISEIGTAAQDKEDTSEPGVVVKIGK